MKKIFGILIMSLIIISCAAQTRAPWGLEVGNTSGVITIDSITSSNGIKYFWSSGVRLTEADVVADSINKLIQEAVDITSLLDGYGGIASGADSLSRLLFTIDETPGAPDAGDSTITHSGFAGLNVHVYRDGDKQYYRTAATSKYKHYRYNSTTGTITVHPPFINEEQYEIIAFEPMVLKELAIQGQESDLLDDIMACWKFDESSGSSFSDAAGSNDGNATATAGVTGRMGRAKRFDSLGDYARIPYDTTLSVTGFNTLTLSAWVYLDSVSIANGQNIICLKTTNSNYWSALLRITAGNDIVFYTKNSSGTTFESQTNSDLNVNTWYHIVAVLDEDEMRIYTNGGDATTESDTFTGTLLHYNDYIYIGTGSSSSVSYIRGIIDEPTIWTRVLTEGEISSLAGAVTYPYN